MSLDSIFEKLNLNKKPAPQGEVAYIIAGLGNPGTEYENTRHNAGFMAIDTLAEDLKEDVKRLKFKSLYCDTVIEGKRCILLKPTTFMNNSGEAVREAMEFYKLSPEKLIVLYDDITLPVGNLRIRTKGSAGGHNGMKSIIYLIDSDNFTRVRIGIGEKPHPDFPLADWVLSRFKKEEGEALELSLTNAAAAIKLIVAGDINKAMNKYNQNMLT